MSLINPKKEFSRLKNILVSRARKVGLPPGLSETPVDFEVEPAKVSTISYSKDHIEEKAIVETIEDCFIAQKDMSAQWINIDGLKDLDLIRKLGENFAIHSLVLEDIVHTGQRPKIEDHEDYIYVVLRMMVLNSDDTISSEQVSLVFNKTHLISFQEKSGDVFHMIRERLRNNKGRIRKDGVDYLAYAIIDAIVDHYFLILESLGERIAELEDELMGDPKSDMAQRIHHLKREVIYLRRQVWPLRELISSLERNETTLLAKTTRPYFRDVYDHSIQVIDNIESFRDVLSGLHDIYLSTISNKMNEVMKVLTIFAAIFIPLTFIAGIYGMNFEYIPELKMKNGYFYAIGFMFFIGMSMLYYFKRKGWL